MAKSCAVFCVEFSADDKYQAEDTASVFRRVIVNALPVNVNVILEDMLFNVFDVQPCSLQQALERATAEVKTLTEERDEARREICTMKSFNYGQRVSPVGYADIRKWDCFKNFFVGDDDHANGGM